MASSQPQRRLRVTIVGGGPVGLSLATSLHHLMNVDITIHDTRWQRTDNNFISWRGPESGVNRREQVVTLQSAVWSRLPAPVQAAMFPADGFSEVWPVGPESPPEKGFPRNVRILDIEDRLLEHAQQLGIRVVPGKVDPEKLDMSEIDLVAIADGPRSTTRRHFAKKFGAADKEPYSLDGNHVEDTVLGLRMQSQLRDPDSVALTVAQNRFLMNAIDGDGYIYMRLTKHEAAEVRGRTAKGKTFVSCIQSQPCMMNAQDSGSLYCPTHETKFVPAEDSYSLLWPRVKEGLDLFQASLKAVTIFRLSMESRPRFSAELTETGVERPVFGALVGDAANAIHFWPGRGLNHGLSSATALSRCMQSRWNGRGLRSADFTTFEAGMAALQHRHKDRAWRAMVQQYNGSLQPISDIIGEAIDVSESLDRRVLIDTVMSRVNRFAARLDGRMPSKCNVEVIRQRIENTGLETLAVLAEAGTWETRLSGGIEVDLDALVPPRRGDVSSAQVTNKPKALYNGAETARTPVRAISARDDYGRDVLSDSSIRATFRHALNFTSRNSLALVEAGREMRALLIRANKEHLASEDAVLDALEDVDLDGHGDADRIDINEFVSAARRLLSRRDAGGSIPDVGSMTSLESSCLAKFRNAADDRGFIEARQAARIVSDVTSSENIENKELASDRGRLRDLFIARAGGASIDRQVFMEALEQIVSGSDSARDEDKGARKPRKGMLGRRRVKGGSESGGKCPFGLF